MIKHPCPTCGQEIDRNYLLRLYAPTKTKKEMAYLFGVTPEAIGSWLRNLNIIHPRANTPHYPELDRMILEGMSNKEISKVIQFEKELFARRRRKLGRQTRKWARKAKVNTDNGI